MLNLTHEHLTETNKQVAGIYDQHKVYEAKIEAVLTDRTLSGGARQARAYDLYVEATAIGMKMTDQLLTDASADIDKLHSTFIGQSELSVADAISISKELKELSNSQLYETLKESKPARLALTKYSESLGNGGIGNMLVTLNDVFIDTNRDKLNELDTLKNASVALEQSFQENLQSVFPNFLEAEAIANSRV